MASWMVHLRITDKLLDELCNLSYTEFVVGNIAPDSGIPNDDWSVFTPSGDVSHFKTTDADGLKDIHLNEYVEQYFSIEQRKRYSSKQKSFYLGYLTHLLTDMMWANLIVRPCKDKFKYLYYKDRTEWIWTLKKDWYDLDFLYIRNNPNFRAFSIYKNAVGFLNEYIDFFVADAFDIRREYITSFYSKEKDDLEREYTYLSEIEMDRFVNESAEKICNILKEEYL
ncbi:zinc dependent phospholipase C family protein [Anaerocolumna sp. MB42-C2]|uniref:zinc dependent phospholipase C family protein n=1 Tax=Anaerocolumna sp. MB42-C2 TaxID=3070997 RepID=UPI0027E04C05|nr:zinc dependent phospholipase C family protein [Anaerocolumna sp. MB42-C2]WMJ88532.1 zinc dependent phospholipase C family protein [Anaerocolumna sp. MB42-C2]